MNYNEYNSAEARNEVAVAATFLVLLRQYQSQRLEKWQWYSILEAFYNFIAGPRYDSARLARTFYDSERRRVLTTPQDPSRRNIGRGRGVIDLDQLAPIEVPERHDIYLDPYSPEQFIEHMEPRRREFSTEQATDAVLQRTVAQVVKEASQGGRQTLIGATQNDPKVIGWARVAGGGESCGFCAMLISRGPVYRKSPQSAGLRASRLESISIWQQYERTGDDTELMALMNKWHPNCDCRVVPVFDEDNWPGRDEYLRAKDLWEEVTKGKKSGSRRAGQNPSGGDKLLAFRRALGDGYKNPSPRSI